MAKKVMVSGCFDLLHSGHVAFFQEAAAYGDLYVALGSDRTLFELKGRVPINSEQERLFMVKAVSHVKDAFISRGSGLLVFPGRSSRRSGRTSFVVNGGRPHARQAAVVRDPRRRILVLTRTPQAGLEPTLHHGPARDQPDFPFRIDLAGGWLDQPWVSKFYPGPSLTISSSRAWKSTSAAGWPPAPRNAAIAAVGGAPAAGGPRKDGQNPSSVTTTRPARRKTPARRTPDRGSCSPDWRKADYEGLILAQADRAAGDEESLRFVEKRAVPDHARPAPGWLRRAGE
jgi:cytidyltransferase-like protein